MLWRAYIASSAACTLLLVAFTGCQEKTVTRTAKNTAKTAADKQSKSNGAASTSQSATDNKADAAPQKTASADTKISSSDEKLTTGDEKSTSADSAAKKDIKLNPPPDNPDTKINEKTGAIGDSNTPASQEATDKVVLGIPELTAGIPGQGDLTKEQIQAWLDDPRNHLPLEVELPLGLAAGKSQIAGLDKNPLTRAKIELGRQLFFDNRLSLTDAGIACATCHDPDHGYAKDTQFGVGIRDQTGNRNSPPAYNRILSTAQFWDGRAATLEEQAKGPIANPIEMGNTHDACVTCLKGIEGYQMQFAKIFGELNIDTVAMAVASFERAIVTGPTPFDYREQFVSQFKDIEEADLEGDAEQLARYKQLKQAMDEHPMSESAIRGRELFFGKANCTACHVGANLTDEKYHNLGVGMDKENPDLGRYEVTKDEKDKGAFKTPTIRNVALSGPFMHDGSQKTLEEVVEWYDRGGHPNPHLSDKIKKLNLTAEEKKDIVEFMKSVTGDFPKVERGRLPAD
jgi:cytochrome c peroxidase